MNARYLAPGVYLDEVFLKPQAALPTAVSGFVGFVDAAPGRGLPSAPVSLHHVDDFEHYFRGRPDSYLEGAVSGFFLNGGVSCHVARADPAAEPVSALKHAVESLAPIEELDLLVVPDVMTLRNSDLRSHEGAFADLDVEAIQGLQRWLLDHCSSQGNRFAILDALPAFTFFADALPTREPLHTEAGGEKDGAMYFPWLKVASDNGAPRLLPPSGHVAGVYARSDARAGVFKAPANEELRGVLDLEIAVGEGQAQLHAQGINALRILPGRGIRVWGARTLSAEPEAVFVSVRRLFITLRRWVDRNMAWATFEPNTPALWMRIERELGAFLGDWWRAGALKGTSPRQAFFVHCNAQTHASFGGASSVVTEVGLAPSLPAEFVVVRIVHREGDSTAPV